MAKKSKSANYKKYTKNNLLEYNKIIDKNLTYLKSNQLLKPLYAKVAENLYSLLKATNASDIALLPILPKSYINHLLARINTDVSLLVRGRFQRGLKDSWSAMFKLGKKHSVKDILFHSNFFTKELTKINTYSSFDAYSLIDYLTVKEEDIAEFEEGDLTIEQKLAISRAKRNLTILRNNVDKLKASGVLYNSYDYTSAADISSKMTIEQRIKFLEMSQEIDDLLKKAEASEKLFLSDNYLQSRYRVLTEDYVDMYDNYIKEKVSTYLSKNIEGVKQIINSPQQTQALINSISTSLEDTDVELVEPNQKAEMIVRTELSIAYNFGKLSSYSGQQDSNKYFRWKVDWEIGEGSTYGVCTACRRMDGEVFTVNQLLLTGTRLDRGLLRYEGKTRTSFKNPTMPVIPFHPNCNCYWELVPIEEYTEEMLAAYADTPTTTSITPITQESSNLGLIAGASLMVGGAFLLSRSNIWKTFSKVFSSNIDNVTETVSEKVEEVIKTPSVINDYIEKEISGDVSEKYIQILEDVLKTNPSTIYTDIPVAPIVEPRRPKVYKLNNKIRIKY